MKVAIVGGGINGLCTAWRLARAGAAVTLYERDALMGATSSASSKLLHGGLRYLETGQFRLVREALRERDAWLARAPQALARPLPTLLPVYRNSRRKRALLALGLTLYDGLAGRRGPCPKSRWLSADQVLQQSPELRADGLVGAYLYCDGLMDDHALGLWVAEQCRSAGVIIHEQTAVHRLGIDGRLVFGADEQADYDAICNIAGPWAEALLDQSGIVARQRLDLVRGSHVLLDRPCPHAMILEMPMDRRVIFALPWRGQTLLGTTEVRQSLGEPIACSETERRYLLDGYNRYLSHPVTAAEIVADFAGLRPLVRSADNPTQARRDYVIQQDGRLLTVFGGKWTTAMALAEKVARKIDQ